MQSIDFPFDKFNFNSDSILEGLPENDLALLKSNMVTHPYKKGEILFREGSYPTGIYYIKKGKAKKYKTDKEFDGASPADQIMFLLCEDVEIPEHIRHQYALAWACRLLETGEAFEKYYKSIMGVFSSDAKLLGRFHQMHFDQVTEKDDEAAFTAFLSQTA